jgi:type I restriction enzyme, S subunit
MNLQKTIKVKIEDLGKIVTGNTPPTSDENNYGGKYPFIKPTDMNIDQRYVYEYEDSYSEQAYKRYRNSYIPKGSTGVVTIGTVGEKMFQAHEDCFTNQSVNCVIPYEDKFDKNYIYYLLKFNIEKVSEANPGTASGRHHVSKSNFMSIKVDIFEDINIQKKISKILSNYDDLIENNLRQIKLLEEKARLTYEEWFLRFKINGQKLDIDEDTGLPFGWESKNLFDLADVRYGYPFKAEQFNNENNGTPIIRIRNILSSSTNDYTTEKVDNKYIVNKGDLLIGMDGEFHINHWTGEQGYLVQRVCSIKTKENSLFGYFSEAIKPKIKYYEETISGATVAHLGKMHLEKIEIVIPSEDILNKLEFFNILLKEKINLTTQNNLLKESRDILLPRLMTGMIDVDKMDIEV